MLVRFDRLRARKKTTEELVTRRRDDYSVLTLTIPVAGHIQPGEDEITHAGGVARAVEAARVAA